MNPKQIIGDIQRGLLNWYPFKANADILYISDKEDCLSDMLKEQGHKVLVKTYQEINTAEFLDEKAGFFSYIIANQILETAENPLEELRVWQQLLSNDGKIILGADNRIGIRYFCGDRDPYTDRSFDGIENYCKLTNADKKYIKGHNYSKKELEGILQDAGIKNYKFYSIFPNLDFPQLIYAENYLPKENLAIRYFPMYHHPDSVFLDEASLYDTLIQNGLFHTMANGYLIECAKDGNNSKVNHVTLSTDRGEEDALATIIYSDGVVEKRALHESGKEKLLQMVENQTDLQKHGIHMVEGKMENDSYVMPYVDAEIALNYISSWIYKDVDRFIEEVDCFRNLILQSSEHVEVQEKEDGMGIILKRGYFDLVPLNCFFVDGEYVFYDQEFYVENYPANVIIYRMLNIVYTNRKEMENILPISFFGKRYNLEKQQKKWEQMDMEFLSSLRNQKELRSFHERYQGNIAIINSNRNRINYSAEEYQTMVIDLFKDIAGKKLVLFGSGRFAARFLSRYKNEHEFAMILDNNECKCGDELDGIPIQSPEILKDWEPDSYKVIICLRDPMGALLQLKNLGVNNIGVYDAYAVYPPKEHKVKTEVEESRQEKKYHVGYIAGVFDLFHIGHLNLLKRAKEQCEYLIVGVVSDQGVRVNKKTEPFIPFEERLEIVRACRYVDEAVEVPFVDGSTSEAYRRYHFDVQFSGSDYVNDGNRLAEKEFLEKNGSTMVFFPYTQSTSSTKLKKAIESRIENNK